MYYLFWYNYWEDGDVKMKYFKYLLLLLFCFVTSVSADTTYKQGVIAKGVTDVYVRKCASSNCDRILSDTGSKISISYPRSFEIIGEEELKKFFSNNTSYVL